MRQKDMRKRNIEKGEILYAWILTHLPIYRNWGQVLLNTVAAPFAGNNPEKVGKWHRYSANQYVLAPTFIDLIL